MFILFHVSTDLRNTKPNKTVYQDYYLIPPTHSEINICTTVTRRYDGAQHLHYCRGSITWRERNRLRSIGAFSSWLQIQMLVNVALKFSFIAVRCSWDCGSLQNISCDLCYCTLCPPHWLEACDVVVLGGNCLLIKSGYCGHLRRSAKT